MVAIKDFGMPSCCMNCEMQIDRLSAGYYCAITEEDLNDNSTLEHRHPNCPLVEIEERKVGKWIELEDFDCSDRGEYLVKCSICDTCNGYSKTDYCPKCGAEMVGGENE